MEMHTNKGGIALIKVLICFDRLFKTIYIVQPSLQLHGNCIKPSGYNASIVMRKYTCMREMWAQQDQTFRTSKTHKKEHPYA